MRGNTMKLIEKIIKERGRDEPTLIKSTTTKLILKGINIDKCDPSSPKYDPSVEEDKVLIEKIKNAGKDLGVVI